MTQSQILKLTLELRPRLSNKFIRRKLFGAVGEKKYFGDFLIPRAHNFFKGYKKTHSDNQSDCWPFYNGLVMEFVSLVNKVGAHTSIISGFSFPMLPSPKSSFSHLNHIVHSLSAILSFFNLNETRRRKDFTFSKTNEVLSSS